MSLKCIKNLNSTVFLKKKKGFSFLEVMISVLVFSIMMTAVSMTFASLFKNYKNARGVQRNIENAQYAMNSMAKSLRTSSIISYTATSVKFFNYSNSSCISYKFSGPDNALQVASLIYPSPSSEPDQTLATKRTWCGNNSPSPYADMASFYVNDASFSVIPSSVGTGADPNEVGEVTISMKVCASSECDGSTNDSVRIQSSVSLRDYEFVGL